MNRLADVSLLLATYFATLYVATAENIQGVAQLNSGTFDKILPKYKSVVVKFDETYPYGDKQDTFKKFASSTLDQLELFVSEVHIADYGDKENSDLAERYNVKKEDYPAYKLFVNGKSEPVSYKGDTKNADEIKRWVIKESGLWLGLPACLEEFDTLVKEFWSQSEADRKKTIEKAEKLAEGITEETKSERAKVYVKTMQKIMEKGEEFLDGELQRVEKLADGKVSDKKKNQLKDRANILTSFQLRKSGKDEL